MLTKISYEIVAAEIEKLYQKEIPSNDEAIAEHCEFIATLIESCGWTVEEFFSELMNRELKEFFPELKELN